MQPRYLIKPMEHGRQMVYGKGYVYVYYVWEGREANIHAAASLARQYFWEDVKTWAIEKWADGSIIVWFIKAFSVCILLAAALIIAIEASML